MIEDYECYYRRNILCANNSVTVCEKCGWYPEVEAKRKAELHRIYDKKVKEGAREHAVP